MGDPKRKRKKFQKPKKMWDKAEVEERRALTERYGLKNKKEIWRAETILRKKRQNARKLLALPLEKRVRREKELLESLGKLGIMPRKPTLDDVLGLNVEALLERRLQTLAWRKGLANTVKQARQLIVHGHIAIDGRRVTAPGYIVTKSQEPLVDYFTPGLEQKVRQSRKKPARKHAAGERKEEKSAGEKAERKDKEGEKTAEGGEKKKEKPPEKRKKKEEGKETGGEEKSGKPAGKEDKKEKAAGDKKVSGEAG